MSPKPADNTDHTTHDKFFRYYAEQSQSDASARRFSALRDTVIRALAFPPGALDVADIGCGPGTQSFLWAELGHRVHGLDVSEHFVVLARERAAAAGRQMEFQIGSASRLPWADGSMDVCLAIELLEHVPDWEQCLDEFTRVLRPGGALFLTTTNVLCPVQQEFDLPLYSWYPRPLKRYFERLVVTRRPELVNHATYPAINWFTFFGLRRELHHRGCQARDRFDVMDTDGKSAPKRLVVRAIRSLPIVRLLAHTTIPTTWVLAIKE
jgi:2-polyprenyl-6-hydroxyphenyl methylase/3-demethylubiquinone-9 3-methyltransferase